jgi:hypothetical protein
MQAGDLRSRVGFYQLQAETDDAGNTEAGYLDEADFECAANIKPRLGGEQILASRLSGTNLVNITVRSEARTLSVNTSWKIKDVRTGVLYNIKSIIDPFEHQSSHSRWIELLCEKGAAEVAAIGENEPLRWSDKHPDDVLEYQVNWSARLAGDTIATSSWTIPAGITGQAASNDDTAATIKISGGTLGDEYQVLNRITTAAGRTYDQTVLIAISKFRRWPDKDPDDIRDYELDWTIDVALDSIANSTWTVPAGIVGANDSSTATKTKIWLSGGSAGTEYELFNSITTFTGRTMTKCVLVRVEQK